MIRLKDNHRSCEKLLIGISDEFELKFPELSRAELGRLRAEPSGFGRRMLFFFRLTINTTTTTISPTIITTDIEATIITVSTFSKEKKRKILRTEVRYF